MSNSVPTGKKIAMLIVLAVFGYLVIYFVGLGISDNGALGMALGLVLGALFAPRFFSVFETIGKRIKIAAEKRAAEKKAADKKAAAVKKAAVKRLSHDVAVSDVNDGEILSIFVGNLAFRVRGRQLAELFEPYGPIESIRIVKDRNTGRGKGFGFVDMKGAAAKKAITELDGSEFFGRILKVSEANAQKNE